MSSDNSTPSYSIVNPEATNPTKEAMYHSAAYNTAGAAIMDFTPIKGIHQQLCAFHTYANDRSRHVEAHHFCTHLSHDFHQCIIYDSTKEDARLIGIEYIVTEELFKKLPADEKKYWHSHKYEVESGLLQLQPKPVVPNAAVNAAEQPAMLNLQKTYGKTIHTWAFDVSPDLPLGPPSLMMSYVKDDEVPWEMVKERDERYGVDTKEKRELRKGYLPRYEKAEGADTTEKIAFEPKVVGK